MAKCPKCGCQKSMVDVVCQVTMFHYEHDDGTTEEPYFEEDSDPADRVRPIYVPKAQVHECPNCEHTWIVRVPKNKYIDPRQTEWENLEQWKEKDNGTGDGCKESGG